MAATLASFRERFPEFSESSDANVDLAISDALLIHRATARGTLFLAAHRLALKAEATSKADGGSGIVSSETIGPDKVDYETQADGDPERVYFASTYYGREFMLIESRTPRLVVTATNVG